MTPPPHPPRSHYPYITVVPRRSSGIVWAGPCDSAPSPRTAEPCRRRPNFSHACYRCHDVQRSIRGPTAVPKAAGCYWPGKCVRLTPVISHLTEPLTSRSPVISHVAVSSAPTLLSGATPSETVLPCASVNLSRI